jgi:hypothetical protein
MTDYLPLEHCGYCGHREGYTDGIGDVGCVNRACDRYGWSRSVEPYTGPLTEERLERVKAHDWGRCNWADVWLVEEMARHLILAAELAEHATGTK